MINRDELINKIEENYEDYYKDYKKIEEKVSNSKAIYKGRPVPFLYVPQFFSEKNIEEFENIIDSIYKIINKTVKLYFENEAIRKLYNFDSRLEELILLDHGYKTNVPMGRFDIFYYGKDNYKFCELNTDGSSAMNEDKVLGTILKQSKLIKDLEDDHSINRFELFKTWIEEVKNISKEYGIEKERPHVCIVDFIENEPTIEFLEFKKTFNENNFSCTIADPRDLNYKEGYLYFKDNKIDIIYRRLVTKDLMERYDEIDDLIKGIKANNTCIIGPIKSQIVHTKLFFEILHDEQFQKYLTGNEIQFINKHVPLTKKLKEIDLRYIDEKDQFIIKPIDNYASKGVYSGKDYKQSDWEEILKEKMEKDYLIQEFCKSSKSKNIIFETHQNYEIKNFNNITGLYIYNEKFYGPYSRIGLNPIISGLHDCYTLPSYRIK